MPANQIDTAVFVYAVEVHSRFFFFASSVWSRFASFIFLIYVYECIFYILYEVMVLFAVENRINTVRKD